MMNIKEFRLRMGWTQEELAEKLDVTRMTVLRWENGDTIPSDLVQYRIDRLIEAHTSKKGGI